jgi:hypothetical protein
MSVIIQRYSQTPFDIDPLVQLFRDYQAFNAALGIPLDFQGFEAEVASLPGRYAVSQGGELYLALWQGQPVGCTAYYRFDATTVELKRLFVSASVTGQGIAAADRGSFGRRCQRGILSHDFGFGGAFNGRPNAVRANGLYRHP